jgi:hypothetical protein
MNTYLVILDTCSKKEYVSGCSGYLFENEHVSYASRIAIYRGIRLILSHSITLLSLGFVANPYIIGQKLKNTILAA